MLTNNINAKIATFLELIPTSQGKRKATELTRALQKGPFNWDPWILWDGEVYRLFYLNAPKPVPPNLFWMQGTIRSAISKDLRFWEPVGVVLEPDPNNYWESGRMLAGSTYKENGVYYLFYPASPPGAAHKNERIGLATSTDGVNWKRHSSNPLFTDHDRNRWYGAQIDTNHIHWRDPFIIKDDVTGKYYMFITASSKQETGDRYRGCVGLAVADTIAGPYELLPPVAGPHISGIEHWPFLEMERPQIIFRNGKYHMIFSCWSNNLNPKWLATLNSAQIKEYGIFSQPLYWLTANRVTGPYKPMIDLPVVKGSSETGLYGINFFPTPNNCQEYLVVGWYHRLFKMEISQRFTASFIGDRVEIRKA